jgi:integrase
LRYARPLNDLQVRRLTERGRHAVGGVHGLMLLVKSPRARSWVLRVTVGDRRRDIGLGGYPSVQLASARDRARTIADQIFAGADPVSARRRQRQVRATPAATVTFEQAARRCHAAKSGEFRSTKHRDDWLSSLVRYAFPVFGGLAVGDVQEPDVLRVLEPIWTAKTETASRVRGRIEVVLSWAKAQRLRTGENPARWSENLEHALPAPAKLRRPVHRRALHWRDVPEFMVTLGTRDGTGSRCLEFAVLTAARSREVRVAAWTEIDFASNVWRVPADHMKAGRPHTVPLSPQAVTLLRSIAPRADSPFIFPAARGGSLSDMTLIKACRDTGAGATPHGFRSSFKEWARTQPGFLDEVSELCLAHVNDDVTRAAYARDGLMDTRRELLERWANHCYSLLGM